METAWDKQYRTLLNKGIEAGRVHVLPAASEKREHPRYRMSLATVWGRVDHCYPVVDKSLTGVAFYSPTPFPVGQVVRITVRQFFVVDALVVGCEMEEDDPLFLNCQYKVRCRMKNLDPALVQVLVALDMEHEGSSAGSAMVPQTAS